MTFSILHSSARPNEWRKVYNAWMSAAVRPMEVQYVLCVDQRWGFSLEPGAYDDLPRNITVVVNSGRRCYVDGVNTAAKAAKGDVFIVNADDQYPCERWDERLEDLLLDWSDVSDFVVSVSTGTPDEHDRGIMVMPILSRARYEKLGYVFFPQYESMYADNDFLEHARKDGVVIDGRHLMFPHKHWLTGERELDAADRAQGRPEAFGLGRAILEKRRASGFAPSTRRTIALCLAGERFEGTWVDAMLTLYGHLVDLDFAVLRVRPGSWSNVFVSREEMRRAVLGHDPKVDLVLWIDDDNILSPEHFDRLLDLLDSRPDVDGAAAWCWIHNEQKSSFSVSCGLWSPDHLHWQPFPPSFANERGPREFETGGLPCLLLRREAVEKAGDGCFMPIVDSRLEHGMTGEDISFFLAAESAGLKFLVDPTVRIPHLKYVSVDPVLPQEGKAAVKVACMIRAKNEGRWIRRVIESVKELCGDIFLMDDGSTDDTIPEATAAGALVLPSPFVGLGLDERRDKAWLLDEVKKRCSPDWILMPDGDEELEPGGCEKIRRVLEKNPPVDCFALRFLYFWDALDQVRVDGVYGTGSRQSLFRANTNVGFRSYYEKEGGNHVGLHCSNAPGIGVPNLVVQTLNVYLYHYGYLLKEDRLRKYRWMLSIDPSNRVEDFYRHAVQGDIPEVPKDLKLKHAGPLELRRLPERLVPQFEMPKPLRETACAAD